MESFQPKHKNHKLHQVGVYCTILNSNILFGQAMEAIFSLQLPLIELLACQFVREPGATSKTCSLEEVGEARGSGLSRIELFRLPSHPDPC